jgi:hypothetical protein
MLSENDSDKILGLTMDLPTYKTQQQPWFLGGCLMINIRVKELYFKP